MFEKKNISVMIITKTHFFFFQFLHIQHKLNFKAVKVGP